MAATGGSPQSSLK
jgi:DNA invertase Pin-like site-specific DNA recombinase